ncbi:MAG: phosphorylase, partial [Campylobacterota bacterium]
MIYLIAALDAEARPLIEHYRLRRDRSLPYAVYRGEEAILLITQPGKANAMMATSALLGWQSPSDKDILINIGVCGAPESHPIGQVLLVHQIIDSERRYYPDILYPHTFAETPLRCVDLPVAAPGDFPVDME